MLFLILSVSFQNGTHGVPETFLYGIEIRLGVYEENRLLVPEKIEDLEKPVMDGGLDYFMNASLKWIHSEKKPEA